MLMCWRLSMTTVAIRLVTEVHIAALSSIRIKINTWPWLQGGQGQLIEMQRGQFTSDFIAVWVGRDVS